MSETTDLDVVEAEIVSDVVDNPAARFADADEARAAYQATFVKLNDAKRYKDMYEDSLGQGQVMLAELERRGAHELLGFANFSELVDHGFEQYLGIKTHRGMRMLEEVQLRLEGKNTEDIAAVVGTTSVTVTRDLALARSNGLLEGEPDKVVGRDGRARATRRKEVVPASREHRESFKRTWDDVVYDLIKRVNRLYNLREDDRYPSKHDDIRGNVSDIGRMIEKLQTIVEDFNA